MCLTVPTLKTVYKYYTVDEFTFKKQYDKAGIADWVVSPPFQGGAVKLGYRKLIKSNRATPGLTVRERRRGTVHKGLHVFSTQAKAKRAAANVSNAVVVAFTAKLKDFVAEGSFHFDNRCAVYTQLTVKGIVAFKKKKKWRDVSLIN